MKKLLKLAVVLLVLLIAAAAVGIYSIDSIARRAVEAAGTRVLGTPTSLGGMSVGVMSPGASMSSLAVANPPAFAADSGAADFLQCRTGTLAVDARSLMGDVVRIPSIRLSDLTLNLVQAGGVSNAETILAHMKQTLGGGSQGSTPASSSGRRYIIDELVIENISINARTSGLPVAVPAANLKVARIRLESLGSAGKDPVGMDQVVAMVVHAVMQSAIEAGASQLPKQLMEGMLGGLSGLGGGASNFNLSIDSGDGLKPTGDLDSLAGRVGVDLSGLSKKAGESIQKGIDDLFKKQ